MPDAPRSPSFPVDSDQASIWIDDVLETNVELPPLPRTAAEVSHLVAKEDEAPDTQRLASLVNNDPVIAATVLQRINSAYFGMRRRITNVRKAVMLLGFLDVANVVLTAGFLQLEEIFSDADQVRVFRHIMRDSIGTGQFARELADGLGLSSGGPAYSAGLIYNLGRLVLLYNAPDDYTALQHADDSTRLPSPEAEAQIFGVDHAELGASVLDAWSMPPVLVHAVRHYAAPTEPSDVAHQRVAALVGTAAVALSTSDAPDELRQASGMTFLADHIESPISRIIELVERRRQRVHDFVSMMMVA